MTTLALPSFERGASAGALSDWGVPERTIPHPLMLFPTPNRLMRLWGRCGRAGPDRDAAHARWRASARRCFSWERVSWERAGLWGTIMGARSVVVCDPLVRWALLEARAPQGAPERLALGLGAWVGRGEPYESGGFGRRALWACGEIIVAELMARVGGGAGGGPWAPTDPLSPLYQQQAAEGLIGRDLPMVATADLVRRLEALILGVAHGAAEGPSDVLTDRVFLPVAAWIGALLILHHSGRITVDDRPLGTAEQIVRRASWTEEREAAAGEWVWIRTCRAAVGVLERRELMEVVGADSPGASHAGRRM